MTKRMCVSFFILAIALSLFVSAFTASISNPRVVLYTNLSDGKYPMLTNSVVANNDNNESVNVTIELKGIWEDKVNLSEQKFSLASGERKEVFYTIRIDKAGYYEGDIAVTFIEPYTQNTLSLVQELVVLAQDENGKVPGEIKDGENNSSSNFVIILIGIIILLVLIGIIFRIKKGKNKK